MRLIDAQEYAKELKNEMDWPGRHPEFISAIECAMADLSDMPTIEAKPIVHAEWIWTVNGEADHEQYWVCSHCKEHTFYKTPFCAGCGATMDLERQGTDE